MNSENGQSFYSLEPLSVTFANSDSRDLDFGRLPIKYIEEVSK